MEYKVNTETSVITFTGNEFSFGEFKKIVACVFELSNKNQVSYKVKFDSTEQNNEIPEINVSKKYN